MDIMKYVPKSKRRGIKEVYKDINGYYKIVLKEGWRAARSVDERVIQEDTIADLRYQIAGIEKSLFEIACDIRRGALEANMVARLETEGRPLTDEETKEECQYILETIDYAGYDEEYVRDIKSACKYILNK